MYLRLFNPKTNKYAVAVVEHYVGEIKDEVYIAEPVEEYASDKLIVDKLRASENKPFNFRNKDEIEAYTKCAECQKQVKSLNSEINRRITQLNMQTDELDSCLQDKEALEKAVASLNRDNEKLKQEVEALKYQEKELAELKKQLSFWQEEYNKLSETLAEISRQRDELETKLKAKIIDYSAEDDVELLKEILGLILKDRKDEAIDKLMEII